MRRAAVLTVAGCALLGLPACRSAAGNANPSASTLAPATSAVPAARTPAAANSVNIAAVGDTILGSTPDLPAHPASYLSPIATALRRNAQIVFGNLEGTLTTQTASKCGSNAGSTCFAFRNPPGYGKYFADAGYTVLNDANNHSHDFGSDGLRQTIHSIHHWHMKQTGLPGQVTVVHASGVPVAFVAFAPYSNTADLLHLRAAKSLIHKASQQASVVVVYMHAGAEGSDADHVTGHEEYFLGEDRGNPERFAHLAVRAGADLVIASGPHVMRGMQFYRHRLIAYSLGNFANFKNFGGGGVLSESGILHVSLSPAGHFESGRLISVRLDGDGRAHLGGASVGFVRRLSKEDFGASAVKLSHRGVISPR